MELVELINQISIKMRLLKVEQDTKTTGQYSEREILLLELIHDNKKMSLSEIAKKFKVVGKSIISSTISNFWKAQLVNKERNHENQRIMYVSLTPKGKKLLDQFRKDENERFSLLIDALNLTSEQEIMIKKILENAVKMFEIKK